MPMSRDTNNLQRHIEECLADRDDNSPNDAWDDWREWDEDWPETGWRETYDAPEPREMTLGELLRDDQERLH